MDFFEKITKNPYKDLYWNIPEEQKRGNIAVIGGNAQNFRTSIKTSEYIVAKFPVAEIRTVLPGSLKSKLPPLPGLVFLKDIANGSFADGAELCHVINTVDCSLIIGDLSKNSVTTKAISEALLDSEKPIIVTRDVVDLIVEGKLEQILMKPDFTIMGSVVQWQKLLRTIYYPKILMPSQPLMQVAEVFHKFTLSYPVQVITLHDGQILIAKNGRVAVVPLVESGYSPLTVWNGELASKIMCLNLFNPGKFLEATVAGVFR